MAKKDGRSFLTKTASFIVDKRKGIYVIYLLLLIFSLITMNWVKVDNVLTDYLAADTETRIGLDLMQEEFVNYASADYMVDNISYETAEELAGKLRKLEGVKEVTLEENDRHYRNAAALFSVTFYGESTKKESEEALGRVKEALSGYDAYTSAEFGDMMAKRVAKEVSLVMVIVAAIIIGVLLLTSRTYMEVPVLILTFLSAALLNKGSNFFFGTISFVSDSVAVVLQLALAIDYAIILCHRYTEERETQDAYGAVVTALCKAIPEISGSCLTTLAGLFAMTFMQFGIGRDLGFVLIKAISISILTVFTLMPGLIYSFSPLIDRTHHKSFLPKLSAWGDIVVKLRHITVPVFAVLLVIGFIVSRQCPYAYSATHLTTFAGGEIQTANAMIADTFTETTPLAVVVPSGDYEKEQHLAGALSALPEVDGVTSLPATEAMDYTLGEALSAREFSEATDMDIDKVRFLYAAYAAEKEEYGKIISGIDDYAVPLLDMFDFACRQTEEGYVSLDAETQDALDELKETLDDGKAQLQGEHYSRIALNLTLPEEGEETFAFLDTVKTIATEIYGDDVLLVGNATSNRDLADSFGGDNLLISILSLVFVMLVLLCTFQSAGVPLLLILVIQGSIWINFSFPAAMGTPLFFLSYLVVSAIQMGANIDYAIVVTNRYMTLRNELSPTEAAKLAVTQAFPTIFTSGTILASAGFIIGMISSDASIASIGICLGRGTVISILLVMGVLPQLLILGDAFIEKTAFSIKMPLQTHARMGKIAVSGMVHGYVNGRIDGNFSGVIRGNFNASVNGSAEEETGDENV